MELWVGKLEETDVDGDNWGVVTMTEVDDDGAQSNDSGDGDGDGVHCKDSDGKFESCCVVLFVVFCAVLQKSVLQLV